MAEMINLSNIYRELKKIEKNMITKEEINNFIETLEIISNKDTMKQIRKSEQNIKSGKVKEINSIIDI